jgi:hypothetical protein
LISAQNATPQQQRCAALSWFLREWNCFLSEPSSPLEVCLRELRFSDAVVLIIGFHAGSDDYHVATLRTGELRVEWRLSLKSKRRFP